MANSESKAIELYHEMLLEAEKIAGDGGSSLLLLIGWAEKKTGRFSEYTRHLSELVKKLLLENGFNVEEEYLHGTPMISITEGCRLFLKVSW